MNFLKQSPWVVFMHSNSIEVQGLAAECGSVKEGLSLLTVGNFDTASGFVSVPGNPGKFGILNGNGGKLKFGRSARFGKPGKPGSSGDSGSSSGSSGVVWRRWRASTEIVLVKLNKISMLVMSKSGRRKDLRWLIAIFGVADEDFYSWFMRILFSLWVVLGSG